MGFIWSRLLRRFTPLDRALDFFLVVGAALRFGHRRGWVSDELMHSVGLGSAVEAKHVAAERAGSDQGLAAALAVGAGAAWRILRRRRARRKGRRVVSG